MIDLLSLVKQDTVLRRVASTNGGEYSGPCPFCGGRDRFNVWPNHPSGRGHWWCRQCERSGDAIAYLVERGDLTPQEAGQMRHGDTAHQNTPGQRKRAQPWRSQAKSPVEVPQNAPRPAWDPSAALAVVTDCEAALWTEAGEKARAWLHKRGLTDDTMRRWRLGYNATRRDIHGLRISRGIVIPCFVDGVPWYIKVRRPVPPLSGPKYQKAAGSKSALYGLDHLTGKRVVVICEGEFDAMLLRQKAGDLVDVVAVGSATTKPALPFLARLAGATRWLVAFDRDGAGDRGADWWGDFSSRVRRVRPLQGNDLTDFHQAGGDLRAWVTYHLERLEAEARPQSRDCVTSPIPTPSPVGRENLEAEAQALLDRLNQDSEATRRYAEIAQALGWPCFGMTWTEWAVDVTGP